MEAGRREGECCVTCLEGIIMMIMMMMMIIMMMMMMIMMIMMCDMSGGRGPHAEGQLLQ